MKMMKPIQLILTCIACVMLTACEEVWNNPYPENEEGAEILYTDFSERPKFLDPVKSYNASESRFIAQIYEPPLQYNYLLRPYQLEPLMASQMPIVRYYDQNNLLLPDDAPVEQIAYSIYEIQIKKEVMYQPHPAFANQPSLLLDVNTLSDFPNVGTREVIADDFVYQIKRIGNPLLNSPILSVMNPHIVGLKEFSDQLLAKYQNMPNSADETSYIDLRAYDFEGAKVIDRYTYQIKIIGKYPQFTYWLAMLFFSPMPWEVEAFYRQDNLAKKNITLDWYPVGTGPYMLTVNNPNRQMILEKNPNFRNEYYPMTGLPEDLTNGLLEKGGHKIPFLDKIIFTLEKESIPRWSKFLQGYYDLSSIGSDNFQQAISISKEKQMKVYATPALSVYCFAFNMLDPVVGGYDERGRNLRLAIASVLNIEEYIDIFLNGRGIVATSPIPLGIEGHELGKKITLSLDRAKEYLARAGYPGGIDPKTQESLVLNYDVVTRGDPTEKSQFAWMQKQLHQLNIELNIRATDYNRFREKMSTGDVQFFPWAWSADYPDPENFLFLFYGPNSRAHTEGVNASNYQNKNYDVLFEQLRTLDPSDQKTAVIKNMLSILQQDMPWVWGFYPEIYTLSQPWNAPLKPSEITANTYKYFYIDAAMREKLRDSWNNPIIWPIWIILLAALLLMVPVLIIYIRKEYQVRKNRI